MTKRSAPWNMVILLVLFSLTGCSEERDAGPTLEAIAANNRGVGLMGHFDYDGAREVFGELAERYPENHDFRINLAIATLNRQKEGDEQAALLMLGKVLEKQPDNLRARYCSAILELHGGASERASEHFRAVAEADPDDAYAAYYLGQTLMQQNQAEAAYGWYRQALNADPYLRSAYYAAFQALQRMRRREEARGMLTAYQRLADNPQARLAEMKYTRMGPKCEALAVDAQPALPVSRPEGELFGPAQVLVKTLPEGVSWSTRPESNLTVADIDGDGRLDVFVTRALRDPAGPNGILLGTEEGAFQLAADHPLAARTQVNAALWGDIDNDGRIDAYLLRRGPNELWRQTESGHWSDITASSASANGEHDSVDGALVDADHDGDLDIFVVNANGPNELLNNNLDGTFRPLATERGIAGAMTASRRVLFADLDQDRDLDLLVIHDTPPHEVYRNDRLWDYEPAPGFEELEAAPLVAAVSADADADGTVELYTLDVEGSLARWAVDPTGAWHGRQLDSSGADRLAVADFDGDGTPEALVSGKAGWKVLSLAEPRRTLFSPPDVALISILPVILGKAHGPSIVGLSAKKGEPISYPPGKARFRFLTLRFTGKEDTGQSMRSNASGLGTRFAARIGSRWSAGSTLRSDSGPGQSLQPVALGLGNATQADFVAIHWPDGVYQTELDLAAGAEHRIAETQRQLSSCPVLFTWDGSRFRFVSDLLGVGGLGYLLAPGVYAEPRPWENFLLPEGALAPRDGRYLLKLAEPLEETAYLDAARLIAYDLPPGWSMVLDERMGVGAPAPTARTVFYHREILPVQAVNDRGVFVTDRVRAADLVAAPPGPLDRRFIGRLQRDHVLELEFDTVLDGQDGEPWLIADGWIEYPYSQTSFAAWQANAAYRAPTLEARGADGRWVVVLEGFGYPAGMPRRMAVPLPKLPAGAKALRLTTNQEIYWDRIGVALAETPPKIPRHALALRAAEVAETGFAERTTGPQRQPYYHYARRAPLWDTRHMEGLYTAFGPATELIAQADDALAIIGPGEEIHLEFEARGVPPSEGWRRLFVLETHGWVKDRDLYTKDGETVGPLPNTGKRPGVREVLHGRYNTRYVSGG
jgi:tetratricopeptide (TPR) repeat protein